MATVLRQCPGRNFGLKSRGTNSEGEQGALWSQGERGGEWGGSIPPYRTLRSVKVS